jgi:hypothetical protein
LTTAMPLRTKRPRAQVAELVDALASGASGLTVVKVRVLSWAPFFQPLITVFDQSGVLAARLPRQRAVV